MINAAITIGFIGLVVLLGKHLFSLKDWGKEVSRDAPSGIVQGKYLPPVFLRSRPSTKWICKPTERSTPATML